MSPPPGAPRRWGARFLALASTACPLGAATWMVPDDFPTIQAALAVAVDGDAILVEPGHYVERIDFGGKAVRLESVGGAGVTTIDGAGGGTVVRLDSDEPRTAVLAGFTIRGGVGESDPAHAGGIAVRGSPTIARNVITANVGCGAGISMLSGGRPLIESNVITANSNNCFGSGAGGAGIKGFGAAADIVANVITRNHTFEHARGAAISLNIGGDSLIARNLIADNHAEGGDGGGIGLVNSTPALVVQNVIVRNRARRGGGMTWLGQVARPMLFNNTIADNLADSGVGSALFLDGRSELALLVNNLLIGVDGVSAIDCDLDKVFLPKMLHNDVFSAGASAVSGPCAPNAQSSDNLSVDPVMEASYALTKASPVIDLGEPEGLPQMPTDFAGGVRVVDGDLNGSAVIDLGAFELQREAPAIPVAGRRGIVVLGGLVTAAAWWLLRRAGER